MNTEKITIQYPPALHAVELTLEQDSPANDEGDIALHYIPPEHRAEVNKVTQAILDCMQTVTKSKFEIGRLLIQVKDLLEPGTFHNWVRSEFGFEERKTEFLMSIYRNLGAKMGIFGRLRITALYHLAAPSTPKKVIEVVEDMIREGHIPKVREVIAIIDAYKQSARREDEHHQTPAQRLAEALRAVHAAVSNQTIVDCEWVLGEQTAQRLDELRMELDELLERVQSLRPKINGQSMPEWTVVSDSSIPVPGETADVVDIVTQLLAKDTSDPSNSQFSGSEQIVPGCTVSVRDEDTSEVTHFTVVADQPGQPEEGRISVESPLAQAVLGKRVGEIAEVRTPDGIVRYTIWDVANSDGHQVSQGGQLYVSIDLGEAMSAMPES